MKTRITFFSTMLYLLVFAIVNGQNYRFASHGGGSKKEEFRDFDVDDMGNSYVIAQYDSNVTFGDDAYTSAKKNSILVKYDKDGKQVMTKNIASESSQVYCALGVSGTGTVVVASSTIAGKLDGKEVYAGTFIGKLGADGNFEWVLQPIKTIDRVSQFNSFRVTAISVVGDAIYVGASAASSLGITLGGVHDDAASFANTYSALFIKIGMDGTVRWIKQIPTPEVANHISIGGGLDYIEPSADGEHLYLAGKVGDGSYNPYEVAFVAKFKTDGTFVWVRKTSSSGSVSWGVMELSTGDIVTGFGVGGAQVIDFGNGPKLEASDKGFYGAMAMLDKDGNVKNIGYFMKELYRNDYKPAAPNVLTVHQILTTDKDQIIFLCDFTGTHPLASNLELISQAGLAGPSKDVGIVVVNQELDVLKTISNTGGNNEWGRKGVYQDGKLFFSGEYESYSHPFFGNYQAEFGEFKFASTGDQDIYVACMDLNVSSGVRNTSATPHAFVISPNPARGKVFIKNNLAEEQSFKLYNATGQLLDALVVNGHATKQFNMNQYQKGMYLIQGKDSTQKLIKE